MKKALRILHWTHVRFFAMLTYCCIRLYSTVLTVLAFMPVPSVTILYFTSKLLLNYSCPNSFAVFGIVTNNIIETETLFYYDYQCDSCAKCVARRRSVKSI